MTKTKVYVLIIWVVLFLITFTAYDRKEEEAARSKPSALITSKAPQQKFYGFIADGIKSIEQFRTALSADPFLAREYAGFDFKQAHFEVLQHDVCQFVSVPLW